MPNPQLSADQLALANRLLAQIRRQLDEVSQRDPDLRFTLKRKVAKELVYDERGKPGHRRKLKLLKRAAQNDKCTLPTSGVVLDRAAQSRALNERPHRGGLKDADRPFGLAVLRSAS